MADHYNCPKTKRTLRVGDYVRWNHEAYGEHEHFVTNFHYRVTSIIADLFYVDGSDYCWSFTTQFTICEVNKASSKVDYLAITREISST